MFVRLAREAHDVLSELQRHLEHRPPKAHAGKKLLRRPISFGRQKYELRQPSRLHILERSLEQSPTHAVPPTLGIDDEVVQHAGGPAQRHIVVRLHRKIGVTDYSAGVLGHKNGGIRRVELRGKKLRVAVLGSPRRREKPTGIELMVRRDEERSEPAEVRKVGTRGAPILGSARDWSLIGACVTSRFSQQRYPIRQARRIAAHDIAPLMSSGFRRNPLKSPA